MLTEEKFLDFIERSESSTLDFKEKLYDFENGNKAITTGKFVKDVISFCNTIREESAYIIFGIKETLNGNEKVGITNTIDDSIFQEKVKDTVTPRPFFSYSTIKSKGLTFGILEFPIYKYEMPLTPTVNKLQGLNIGKIYYRSNSSNTEATLTDTFRINDWLRSLPKNYDTNDLNEKISSTIVKLSEGKEKLSVILSESLKFAKEHDLKILIDFCRDQISGIKIEPELSKNYSYRLQTVYISIHRIEIPNLSYNLTTDSIKKQFKESSEFNDYRLILHHSLIELEDQLEHIKQKPKSFIAVLNTDTQTALELDFKKDLFIYLFPENILTVYKNIRQKAIDILMEL